MFKVIYLVVFTILTSVLTSANALAIMQQDLTLDEADSVFGDWKPIQVEGDAVSWEVFGSTKEIEGCVFDADEGYDICITKPEYSEEVQKLDKKQITLMGYMFPLENSEKLTNFLIIPYPLSCPFHTHTGPAQTIEVFTKKPVKFSFDPITLKGEFSVRFNEETGTFYYLNDAIGS